MNTTIRTTFVALVTTLGLTLGLVAATTATAAASSRTSAQATAKPKLVKLRPYVKLRVAARSGAVLYSTRTGKVVRDRKGKARRLAAGSVKTFTHRSRYKRRDYRRVAGKTYMVRTSALRAIPKPRPTPKPVPKPTPRPTPPAAPKPIPAPTAVKGPYNSQITTLVFGDSNSAPDYYNDRPGDPMQAWWSSVKQATGSQFQVKAHGGSGMVNSGCWWGRFDGWLPLVDDVKPDFIVVTGGQNDFLDCHETPTYAQQQALILGYMRELRAAADRNGIPPERVYVWNVWGPGLQQHRSAIVGLMRQGAVENGLTFVDVAPLTAALSKDGTHPNANGSRWLATQFLARSDYAQRLAAWTPAPAPAEVVPAA